MLESCPANAPLIRLPEVENRGISGTKLGIVSISVGSFRKNRRQGTGLETEVGKNSAAATLYSPPYSIRGLSTSIGTFDFIDRTRAECLAIALRC